MVFPYCVRNKPAQIADFRDNVDRVFEHLVMTESGDTCGALWIEANDPLCVKGQNLGKNTIILEDFDPDPQRSGFVRARTAYRYTENGQVLQGDGYVTSARYSRRPQVN